MFRRVEEAEKRPVLAARLRSSLNISHDFLFHMHNLSGEVQIFTEVEMTSLETLINETEVRTHTLHEAQWKLRHLLSFIERCQLFRMVEMY